MLSAKTLGSIALFSAGLALFLLGGCGGGSSTTGSAGSRGSAGTTGRGGGAAAGTSGGAGQGGHAGGAAGAAGNSGTAAEGGHAGTAGTAGAGGQSGQAGAGTAGRGGAAGGSAGASGASGSAGAAGKGGGGAAGGAAGASGASGSAGASGAGGAGPSTCTDGGTGSITFDDDFSAGLQSKYWTVQQTTAGLFTVAATNGDVQLTKVGSNASGPIQSVAIDLNLAAFGTSMIKGDFDYSVDFSNAMLGPSGVDQVELHASFADNSILFDVYDNSSGLNTHVWTGSLLGQMATTATGGTFRISRVGTTLSGYFGSTLLYSTTSSSPLTDVTFILQLQPGSDDDISVIYDNFKFTAACGS